MNDRDDFKTIGSVPAITFDSEGVGPYRDTLTVMANIGASTNYPSARITLLVADLAAVGLTLQQSRALRTMLEFAERDVAAGCPELAVEESAR